MRAYIRTICVGLGLFFSPQLPAVDHWQIARDLCPQLVAEASALGADTEHTTLLSPLNRYLATHRYPVHAELHRIYAAPNRIQPSCGRLQRLAVGANVPQMPHVPLNLLWDTIALVEADGGEVHLVSGSTSSFTLDESGKFFLDFAAAETDREPFAIVHERQHFLDWKALVERLTAEMPLRSAQHFALELIETPDGTWFFENRAVAAQLAAALESGYVERPKFKGAHIYSATNLFWQTIYPHQLAMEHALRFQVLFHPQMTPHSAKHAGKIPEIQEKLENDLSRFADLVVEKIMQHRKYLTAIGQRTVQTLPKTYPEFFGVVLSSDDHERMLQSYQLTYLLEAVERYRLKNGITEAKAKPTITPPPPTTPRRNRWWPF